MLRREFLWALGLSPMLVPALALASGAFGLIAASQHSIAFVGQTFWARQHHHA